MHHATRQCPPLTSSCPFHKNPRHFCSISSIAHCGSCNDAIKCTGSAMTPFWLVWVDLLNAAVLASNQPTSAVVPPLLLALGGKVAAQIAYLEILISADQNWLNHFHRCFITSYVGDHTYHQVCSQSNCCPKHIHDIFNWPGISFCWWDKNNRDIRIYGDHWRCQLVINLGQSPCIDSLGQYGMQGIHYQNKEEGWQRVPLMQIPCWLKGFALYPIDSHWSLCSEK